MALVAAVVATKSATAEPIAIESYAGARPPDAAGVIEPLMSDLARRGYVTGKALVSRIESEVSLSGESLDAEAIAALESASEAGFATFRQGRFDEAATQLAGVWTKMLSRPATIAEHQELRDAQIRVLLGLGLVHHRLGKREESIRYFSEFIRSFPDREISRPIYGPEPQELVKSIRAELASSAKGSLRVEVLDDPGGVVFVNERYVSVGSADLDALYPGVYRVLVRGKSNGRVHHVNVEPGSRKLLQVRLSSEAALRTDQGATLVFATEEDRANMEAAGGAFLASALRSPEAVLIGIRNMNGRRTLIGTLVAADTGRPIRSGSLAMDPLPPSTRQLAALGRFIASGEAAPDIQVGSLVPETKPIAPRDRGVGRAPWYSDTWGWVLVAGGLVSAGSGVGLFVNASNLDDDADAATDDGKRQDFRDRADTQRTLGTVFTPLGGALVVLGVIKLAWTDPPLRGPSTRLALGLDWVGIERTF